MYTPTKRVIQITRHEWAIESPATAKDIGDALFLARNDMEALSIDLGYDDAYHVEARDSEIVIYTERHEAT